MIDSWKRLKGESSKIYFYFCYYKDLGSLRSLGKVGEKFGKTRQIIERYSSRYDWVKRVEAWDDYHNEIKQKEQEEEIKKFAKEQIQFGERLIDKGDKTIEILTEDLISPSEATKMLSEGIRIKRVGLGLPEKITEEKVNISGNTSMELFYRAYDDARKSDRDKESTE